MSFPPRSAPTMAMAIKTPQQQQLQPEQGPAIAMAIMTQRQQHDNREERGPAIVLYHQQQCQHVRY